MDSFKAWTLTLFIFLLTGQTWASNLGPKAADFPTDHPMRQFLSGKSFCQSTSSRVNTDLATLKTEIDTLAMLMGEGVANEFISPVAEFLTAKSKQRLAIETWVEKTGSPEAIEQTNREVDAALERINKNGQLTDLYNAKILSHLDQIAKESVIEPYFESVFQQILEPLYLEIYQQAPSQKKVKQMERNLFCDLSPAQILAIIYYSGQGSAPIERALLGDKMAAPFVSFSAAINSGLRQLRPFQGIIQSGQSRMTQETFIAGEFEVPRYFSGSILNHKPFGGHQLKIQSESCRWIALYSVNFNEDEVLCPTKSKFKILQTRNLNPGEFGYDSSRQWLHVRVTQIK